ncbi:sugar transporter [Thalassovita mangrovi]|uniref:Sugar transporter n=1 Tax=Thalassovita mangrovi TaxID=2692236 RepID=A0A6L8LIJ6_9RHOB|nr:sugar transporter [Thalassovita mangrovi]MYM55838.1 sugar transporter [Thalassovita mangrovi]
MLASFVAVVMLPLAAVVFYLYAIAEDQYASSFGFTVRSEEMSGAQSLLGGLASLSGSSSSDTDILYEFIQSQTMVEAIDKRLNLREIYSRPAFDPVFTVDPQNSIEDLVKYWQRVVQLSYASGSGLIEVQVKAFTAEDAHRIAEAIIEESTIMINELSAIARADATGYARDDLEQAVTRLKATREALTRFRSETRIVDPSADIQGQMGLLNSLESQLAATIIEMNLLLDTARDNDPRVEQARRRIAVIQSLIEKERQKFGIGDAASATEGTDYSTLVGEFERLMVDVEYAQKSYLAAQAALDTAQAEAQRQSRYLATYAKPTLPQSAQYPQRLVLSLISGAFLLLFWAIGVLIYYSLRDRR